MKVLRSLVSLLRISLLVLFPTLTAMAQTVPIDQFFADYWEEALRDDPEMATSVDRHEYDDQWANWSPEGLAVRREHIEKRLEELNRYDFNNCPKRMRSVRGCCATT